MTSSTERSPVGEDRMCKAPVFMALAFALANDAFAQPSPRILVTKQSEYDQECWALRPCAELSASFGLEGDWVALSLNGVREVSEVHFGVEAQGPTYMHIECSGEFYFTYTGTETPLGVQWIPHATCRTLWSASQRLGSLMIWIPSPGEIRIVDHPTLGEPAFLDCDGVAWPIPPEHRGIGGVGGVPGYIPCIDQVPITESSWSRLKWLYRE
jgi:hypothetical protein